MAVPTKTDSYGYGGYKGARSPILSKVQQRCSFPSFSKSFSRVAMSILIGAEPTCPACRISSGDSAELWQRVSQSRENRYGSGQRSQCTFVCRSSRAS